VQEPVEDRHQDEEVDDRVSESEPGELKHAFEAPLSRLRTG
jgi:hypothetical protein